MGRNLGMMEGWCKISHQDRTTEIYCSSTGLTFSMDRDGITAMDEKLYQELSHYRRL